jgi:photosystem I subunit 9
MARINGGDLVVERRNNCVSTLTIRFKFLISYLLFIQIKFMENLQKYLSTAPVLFMLLLTFTAGFIIEINRFFLIC